MEAKIIKVDASTVVKEEDVLIVFTLVRKIKNGKIVSKLKVRK